MGREKPWEERILTSAWQAGRAGSLGPRVKALVGAPGAGCGGLRGGGARWGRSR